MFFLQLPFLSLSGGFPEIKEMSYKRISSYGWRLETRDTGRRS